MKEYVPFVEILLIAAVVKQNIVLKDVEMMLI